MRENDPKITGPLLTFHARFGVKRVSGSGIGLPKDKVPHDLRPDSTLLTFGPPK